MATTPPPGQRRSPAGGPFPLPGKTVTWGGGGAAGNGTTAIGPAFVDTLGRQRSIVNGQWSTERRKEKAGKMVSPVPAFQGIGICYWSFFRLSNITKG